jgi:hypothetical protein
MLIRFMALLGMKRCGLDVERHAPVAESALADGREPDFCPAPVQHAPELARALADRDRAELRQSNRARALLTEANGRLRSCSLVAQAK